jgi:hypothetical protein
MNVNRRYYISPDAFNHNRLARSMLPVHTCIYRRPLLYIMCPFPSYVCDRAISAIASPDRLRILGSFRPFPDPRRRGMDWARVQEAKASIWTAEEIDLAVDRSYYQELSPNEPSSRPLTAPSMRTSF